MKTLRYFIPLTVLLFVQSCKKDYSYEGGFVGDTNCLNCAYLPLCDSSEFVYVDSTATGVDTTRDGVLLAGDTSIAGIRYTRVAGFSTLGQTLLFSCAANDYRAVLPVTDPGIDIDSLLNEVLQGSPLPIPPGLFQLPTSFNTSILKASRAAGATWTDTIYSVTIPFVANVFAGVDYTIVQKGIQRQVFGKAYTDVFHVQGKVRIAVNASGIPVPPIPVDVTTDYYLAKGVGLIEMNVTESGTLQANTRLFSYTL